MSTNIFCDMYASSDNSSLYCQAVVINPTGIGTFYYSDPIRASLEEPIALKKSVDEIRSRAKSATAAGASVGALLHSRVAPELEELAMISIAEASERLVIKPWCWNPHDRSRVEEGHSAEIQADCTPAKFCIAVRDQLRMCFEFCWAPHPFREEHLAEIYLMDSVGEAVTILWKSVCVGGGTYNGIVVSEEPSRSSIRPKCVIDYLKIIKWISLSPSEARHSGVGAKWSANIRKYVLSPPDRKIVISSAGKPGAVQIEVFELAGNSKASCGVDDDPVPTIVSCEDAADVLRKTCERSSR